VRKPADLVYGVDERPPLPIALLSGLQQAALLSVMLVYPLLVGRAAAAPPAVILDILSLSMVAIGLGTVLQAARWGPVGSGYLCPPITSAIYLAPSLQAARAGGLPLVFGMTVLAGLLQAVSARGLRWLRPLFPPELNGLVIVLIAVTSGSVGVRYLLGIDTGRPAGRADAVVAAVSLGTMVVLNVWTRGLPRLFCLLLGMVTGYATAAATGDLTAQELQAVAAAAWVSIPRAGHLAWTFDPALAVPFAVAALAASLKTAANVTSCQRMNDADWVRPELGTITGGVVAEGLGSAAGGLLGSVGLNTSSGAVGLASATGVASRHVAYAAGGFMLLLAVTPKAAAIFAVMPPPVTGAALLFSSAFFLVSGVQILASRMLDARRTIVIGLSFMVGLAADLHPQAAAAAPTALRPFVSSSLILGTLSALLLNAVFRLGIRRTERLAVPPDGLDPEAVDRFMERQGGLWGARRDVVDRARFSLVQSLETIIESCAPRGPIDVEASFDEFRLDLRLSYDGPPLELPDRRPTAEEVMESDEGQRRLAGYLLRHHADRVQAGRRAGRSTLHFHFQH
jgi:NCS2 family nucleobase:cation symporter-2